MRAQHLDVSIDSKLGKHAFIPGSTCAVAGDTIQCTALRLYLGSFMLLNEGDTIMRWPFFYFLIDFSDPSTTVFQLPDLPDIDFDEVSFLIGVDSSLQVDGPHGGVLDPAEGMYWTWQNGYIDVKVEGTASLSTDIKEEFAWHLGGYQGPLNASVRCVLPCSKKRLHLTIDWFHLFHAMDMKTQHHVMSPSAATVQAMEALKSGITAR